MGEVSQAVFVSEILAQVRGRGIDLDRLSQHKALQDGLTLDKKEAIQHLTKLLVDQMQKWLPVVQADSGSQHQIAALQAEIAELKAKAGSSPQQEAPAREGNTPSPPNRVESPIEAALQGNRPVAFDPAQLLVTPRGTNQWLENNMPESFSDSKYKAWFKTLKLDITSRQTVERNIVAMDNWWQNQPEAAESTIHRVAVCLGISPGKIKSGHNENLLKVMTEVDLHMDFMGTEHVEHKTDHQIQGKMVRFWKCSAVTLHENQTACNTDEEPLASGAPGGASGTISASASGACNTSEALASGAPGGASGTISASASGACNTFYVGDTPESGHVYYQWNKMKNLLGWWVKKIWHSYDGWLLVAKKEEFSLLVFDPPRQLDQNPFCWWKKPLALRVALNPKGKPWLQTLAQGLCRLSSIYQKMLYPLDQDPVPLVVIEATWGLHPKIQFTLLQPKPASSADQDGEATLPMAM
eukprot:symbB.v1.2.028753.t1/scaffold3072.1/size64214/4